MGGESFIDAARQALWILTLGLVPILVPALIVGMVMGMVQAATSINEATLSFVPKLAVVGLCLLFFGGFIMSLLVDFTQDMFARIPDIVR
jgi:flagellar biosynthesis protein FliQ